MCTLVFPSKGTAAGGGPAAQTIPSRPPVMEKVPHGLPTLSTSQTHAPKDHCWAGFEKLLFSSGAKSSFAASTTIPTKDEQPLEASSPFDAQPTVKSELVL